MGTDSHLDRRSALVSVSLSPPATSLSLLTCLWCESTFELSFFGNENKRDRIQKTTPGSDVFTNTTKSDFSAHLDPSNLTYKRFCMSH